MGNLYKLPTELYGARVVLYYLLIRTTRRLTFDILFQAEDTRYKGEDDGEYFKFVASNGYEVISRSRMDIQTERIWLLGGQPHERSGTMVFSSDEKRDNAAREFTIALSEWAKQYDGLAVEASDRRISLSEALRNCD